MRKEVEKFAQGMEETLKTHDYKKGNSWKKTSIGQQEKELKDEVSKLSYDLNWCCRDPHKSMSQCLDVANRAMFIYSLLEEKNEHVE